MWHNFNDYTMIKRFFILFALLLSVSLPSARSEGSAAAPTSDKGPFFGPIDGPAEFPGGQMALFQLLHDSIIYPPEAKEKHLEGLTIVRFRVEKDGTVDSVAVKQSSGYEPFDMEAVRVIRNLPKWKPAWRTTANGLTHIASEYTVPIRFKFPEENAEK